MKQMQYDPSTVSTQLNTRIAERIGYISPPETIDDLGSEYIGTMDTFSERSERSNLLRPWVELVGPNGERAYLTDLGIDVNKDLDKHAVAQGEQESRVELRPNLVVEFPLELTVADQRAWMQVANDFFLEVEAVGGRDCSGAIEKVRHRERPFKRAYGSISGRREIRDKQVAEIIARHEKVARQHGRARQHSDGQDIWQELHEWLNSLPSGHFGEDPAVYDRTLYELDPETLKSIVYRSKPKS